MRAELVEAHEAAQDARLFDRFRGIAMQTENAISSRMCRWSLAAH
jgi:hypothetical protein